MVDFDRGRNVSHRADKTSSLLLHGSVGLADSVALHLVFLQRTIGAFH